VWQLIRQLAVSGVTILLTTQYLEEADQLAERIAVIDHGRKIAEGTSRELKAATGSGFLHVALADRGQLDAAAELLAAQLGAPVHRSPEGAELSVLAGDAAAANAALAALIAAGFPLADFRMGAPSLDEVFFALTGRPDASATDARTTPAAQAAQ
jgi:ABC-2 type transport system ATP-binding protein